MEKTHLCKLGGDVWRVIRFSAVLFLIIFPMTSCSKSNPALPDGGAISDLRKLREMLWTEGDHTIAAQAAKERRADVSNVVLGKEYMKTSIPAGNGKRGYILTHDDDIPSAQDPVELVVVTWSQMSSMPYDGGTYDYWDVYFSVLAYDENGMLSEESPDFQVPNPTWNPGYGPIPAIQNYPCVTAHIEKVGSNPGTPLLVVDIAFQRGCYYYGVEDLWMVSHVQYVQSDPDLYSSFDKVGLEGGVDRVAPADPWNYYAIHPDIVYGTYYREDGPGEIANIDYLMVVFEMIEKETSEAAIVYAQTPDPDDHWPWYWTYQSASGTGVTPDQGIPQYPRIDAGIDCSDPLLPNPQFYIAAVVWHTVYDAGDFLSSVLFFNYKPFNVPPFGRRFLTYPFLFDQFDTIAAPNGLPYVDIDPIENLLEGHTPETYSHMVWTRFILPDGSNIKPYYTNSELVMQYWWDPVQAIRQVYDGGDDYREGLTAISTYSDQTDNDPYDRVGTIQFISAQNEATEYPVYSVDFSFEDQDPQTLHFEDPEGVSDSGNSSSDEYPWECGPSSAMRGGDVTFCAWTKKFQQEQPPLLIYDIISDQDL